MNNELKDNIYGGSCWVPRFPQNKHRWVKWKTGVPVPSPSAAPFSNRLRPFLFNLPPPPNLSHDTQEGIQTLAVCDCMGLITRVARRPESGMTSTTDVVGWKDTTDPGRNPKSWKILTLGFRFEGSSWPISVRPSKVFSLLSCCNFLELIFSPLFRLQSPRFTASPFCRDAWKMSSPEPPSPLWKRNDLKNPNQHNQKLGPNPLHQKVPLYQGPRSNPCQKWSIVL